MYYFLLVYCKYTTIINSHLYNNEYCITSLCDVPYIGKDHYGYNDCCKLIT